MPVALHRAVLLLLLLAAAGVVAWWSASEPVRAQQAQLTLNDFDDSGLDVELIALVNADDLSDDNNCIYCRERFGVHGVLVDGGTGADGVVPMLSEPHSADDPQTYGVLIRVRRSGPSGLQLNLSTATNSYTNPEASGTNTYSFNSYLSATGPGNDLSLYVQTAADGVASTPIRGNVGGAIGGGYVIVSLTTQTDIVVDGIYDDFDEDDGIRFIIALARTVTAPTAPTGVQASAASSTAIDVSWTAVDGADDYLVRWSTTSGGQSSTDQIEATGTEAQITGLSPNTRYYVTVSARNAGGTSSASTEVDATTTVGGPGSVGTLTIDNITSSSFRVSWAAVPGADGYQIQRRFAIGSWITSIIDVSGLRYTFSSLAANFAYEVRVRATETGSDPGPWTSRAVTTNHAAPGQVQNLSLALTAGSETSSITATWTAVSNADDYLVQWRETGGTFNAGVASTSASHEITGLDAKTEYEVRVRARRTRADTAAWSASVSLTTLGAAPAAVGTVTVATTNSQATVSWPQVTNADGYRVAYRITGAWTEVDVSGGTTTTHVIGSLSANTAYEFRVRAVRTGHLDGPWSATVEATTKNDPPGQVQNLSLALTAGSEASSITATWDAVADADGYEIQHRLASGSWLDSNIVSVDVSRHTYSSLAAGTAYQVRVRAQRAGADTALWSGVESITTFAEAPGNVGTLSFDNYSSTGFRVSWAAVPGADGYQIQHRPGTGNWLDSNIASVSGRQHTYSSLSANTAYQVRVRATKTDAETAAWTTQTATTYHEAPGQVQNLSLTLTDGSETSSFTATWDSVADAEGYLVQWRETGGTFNDGAVSMNTEHAFTGLDAKTEYEVRVRARRALADTAAWSGVETITTLGAPPAAVGTVTVTTTNRQATVSWPQVTNADGYRVAYRVTGGWTEVDVSGGTTTTHVIGSLSANTAYEFRVRAVRSGHLDGPWSATVEATTLNDPPGTVQGLSLALTAGSETSSITATWTAVADADDYLVQWRETGGTFNAGEVSDDAEHEITGLDAKTEYEVRVRAQRANAEAVPWSATVSLTTLGAPPAAVGTVTVTTTNRQATVSWPQVTNADGYRVAYRVTGSWTEVDVSGGTTTTQTIDSLASNTTYEFRVRAVRSGHLDGPWSATVEATTLNDPSGTVQNLSLALTAGSEASSITATWTAVADADDYLVQWRETGGTFNAGVASTIAAHEITGLDANTTYEVRVRAQTTGAATAPWSSTVSLTTLGAAPAAVGTVTVTTTNRQATVSWPQVTNADGYRVAYRVTGGWTEVDVSGGATTAQTIDSLASNTTYEFRVRALRSGHQDGPWTATVEATTLNDPPGTVQNLSLALTAGSESSSITATWDSVGDAEGYLVQWRETGGTFNAGVVSTSAAHEITGLDAETTYDVRVRAQTTGAATAPWSGTVSLATLGAAPAAVGTVTVATTNRQATVSWPRVTNADGYRVAYRVDGTPTWTEIDVSGGATTTRVIGSLAANTAYEFRVRAVRSGHQDGAWTGTVEATTRANAPEAIGGLLLTPSPTAISARWTEQTNVAYEIQWRIPGDAWSSSETTTRNSHTIRGLTPLTSYDVRVRATRTNAISAGAWSTASTTTTTDNVAPVFPAGIVRSVAENERSGTDVGLPVTADDPNGDDLVYSITGSNPGGFTIHRSTGQIKTGREFNYETDATSYTVTVTAADPDGLTAAAPVTINILDVNDPPAFATDSVTLRVDENTPPQSRVGAPVTASDADIERLVYTLGGTDAASFKIDSRTGQITVGSGTVLDYETKSRYSVTVTATDSSNATDRVNVTIEVLDLNEVGVLGTATFRVGRNGTTYGLEAGRYGTLVSGSWPGELFGGGVDRTVTQIYEDANCDWRFHYSGGPANDWLDAGELDTILVTVRYHDRSNQPSGVDTRNFILGGFIEEELSSNGVRLSPPLPSCDWSDKTGTEVVMDFRRVNTESPTVPIPPEAKPAAAPGSFVEFLSATTPGGPVMAQTLVVILVFIMFVFSAPPTPWGIIMSAIVLILTPWAPVLFGYGSTMAAAIVLINVVTGAFAYKAYFARTEN